MDKLMHRFCDLPKGTKFKYPDGDDIWVVIEGFGDGLVAKFIPINEIVKGHSCIGQSLCCFVDDLDWLIESEVEVLP